MAPNDTRTRRGWASSVTVAGGLLMAVLWAVFTTVHGPTSFNEDRAVLGGSMHFWGMLLGSVPPLLIATGLILAAPLLDLTIGRTARVGYVLLLIGLVVPALIDLSLRALGAPFFLPVAAIGVILLAGGTRHHPRVSAANRLVLMLIGVLLVLAFAWALLPTDLTDRIGGFRIYGALAHLGVGIGWAFFGASLGRTHARPT